MTCSQNRRILVIDDNPSIHEDFRKILGDKKSRSASLVAKEKLLFGEEPQTASKTQGFEIDSAHQGDEALALVERARDEGRPYSVAFVDVRMPPGWDGIETIERIWDVDPQIQFVICTAFSDYSVQEILRRVGMSDRLLMLKKPCDCAEITLIATALNQKWNLKYATSYLQPNGRTDCQSVLQEQQEGSVHAES